MYLREIKLNTIINKKFQATIKKKDFTKKQSRSNKCYKCDKKKYFTNKYF